MPWVVTKVSVKQEGEYHPSGSTIYVSDEDRAALVSAYARDATDDEIAEASALAPGHTDLMVSPEAIDAFVAANPPPTDPPPAPQEPMSRVADVKDAFDLLDAADFVDGKPNAAKLAAVLGYEATVEEVEAAIALRDAL